MITVAEIIKTIVRTTPFLEEGLASGIINLSALARQIQPNIEEHLIKPVSISAIIMALKRFAPSLKKSAMQQKKHLRSATDLTIRSGLTEFTFYNSDTILEKQKALLHEIENRRDKFITFTQGLFEITIIVNSDFEKTVERIFKKEKLLSKFNDLSAITIHLPSITVHTPGIHYAILKQLAWESINVIEEVSTFTEYTIILEKHQIDRAFTILKRYLWK